LRTFHCLACLVCASTTPPRMRNRTRADTLGILARNRWERAYLYLPIPAFSRVSLVIGVWPEQQSVEASATPLEVKDPDGCEASTRRQRQEEGRLP
jgi:hypothetical protein